MFQIRRGQKYECKFFSPLAPVLPFSSLSFTFIQCIPTGAKASIVVIVNYRRLVRHRRSQPIMTLQTWRALPARLVFVFLTDWFQRGIACLATRPTKSTWVTCVFWSRKKRTVAPESIQTKDKDLLPVDMVSAIAVQDSTAAALEGYLILQEQGHAWH